MMEPLSQLPPNAMSIVILLLVAGIKIISAKFSSSSSNSIFSLYCQELAKKVNKESNSNNHRKIAGFIATMITATPLLLIIWLFEAFVSVPWLWSSLLLYFSLGGFSLNRIAKKEANALLGQDKYQAKQIIAPHILRDSQQMSPLGLTKATIEMILLKKLQLQFAVGFFFLIFGPFAALSCRLVIEIHYQWNIKRDKFIAFGEFINRLYLLLIWLPSRVFFFIFMITSLNRHSLLYWRLVKTYFFQLNNNLLISFLAFILGVKLGGVAMYDKNKLRRASFNEQGQQPEPKHIILAIKQLNLVMTLVIGLLISMTIILAILNSPL